MQWKRKRVREKESERAREKERERERERERGRTERFSLIESDLHIWMAPFVRARNRDSITKADAFRSREKKWIFAKAFIFV